MRLVSTSRIFFWVSLPLVAPPFGDWNARAKWIRPASRFCLWQNACTAQRRRRPEGRLDASQEKLQTTWEDLDCYPLPKSRNNLDIVGCKLTVPRCCGFLFVKFLKVKKMPDKNFSNWMDLNYGFRRIENSDGNQCPLQIKKGAGQQKKWIRKMEPRFVGIRESTDRFFRFLAQIKKTC